MADEADRAEADVEAFLAEGIYRARKFGKPLEITGECHYCGEPCDGKFCDHECADGFNDEQTTLRKQGLV